MSDSSRSPDREELPELPIYRLYRPSNGGEGEAFMDRWCRNCEEDRAFREDRSPSGCDLILRAMIWPIEHPEYPQEWREKADDGFRGYCTAFRSATSEETS